MVKKKNKVIMSTIEQGHITEDLILKIFSYLPPITLIRFKSVSKTWYSLVSNPDFCRRHTALYQLYRSNRCRRDHIDDDHHMLEEPSSPGILLRRNFNYGLSWNIVIHPHPLGLDHEQKNLALLVQNLNDYRPAPFKNNESFMLLDSCNGLLLYVHKSIRKEEEKLLIKKRKKEEEKQEIVFYVCNPITKDYIKLPTIDIIDEFKEVEHADKIAHIVFNPSSSLTYKVFTWVKCVKQSSSRSDFSHCYERQRLYVYSSEARSWRPSVLIDPAIQFSFSSDFKAVLWNGVLHWTRLRGGSSTDDDIVLSLCYDIEKETVWTMKFPKMATGYTHQRLLYFGLCGDRLLILIEKQDYQHDRFEFPSSFDVLEKQKQNGEGNEDDMWTVRYRVNFEEVDNDFYSKVIRSRTIFGGASIFDIYRRTRTKNGEEIVEEEVMLMKLELVGSERDHRIIFFNLTSNTFENEKLHSRETLLPHNGGIPGTGYLNYTEIFQYNATLFPP